MDAMQQIEGEVLTEDEFDKRFTLVDFEDGSQQTDELEVIQQFPANRVWSQVDDGDGGPGALVSGFACVNFICWQVTEEPHTGGYCDIVVEFDDLDFEDETDDEEVDNMLGHLYEQEI